VDSSRSSSSSSSNNQIDQSRRSIVSSAAALVAFTTAFTNRLLPVNAEEAKEGEASTTTAKPEEDSTTNSTTITTTIDVQKVLVLGATGFVGSRVTQQLKNRGLEVVGTSRDGRDGTYPLDVTDTKKVINKEVETLCSGCQVVISCIGSIGSPDDKTVNAASALAALGALDANVRRFVFIGVAPEVREASKDLTSLNLGDYMEGKAFSEKFISNNFGLSEKGRSFMVIEPTFIFGGDSFQVNPPRVEEGYGKFVETVLSNGIFRTAAEVAPGILGVALEPPVNVNDVAGAAVAGALGYSESILDTHDKIVAASASLK